MVRVEPSIAMSIAARATCSASADRAAQGGDLGHREADERGRRRRDIDVDVAGELGVAHHLGEGAVGPE
jgi:hypothetical protein